MADDALAIEALGHHRPGAEQQYLADIVPFQRLADSVGDMNDFDPDRFGDPIVDAVHGIGRDHDGACARILEPPRTVDQLACRLVPAIFFAQAILA